MPKHWGLGIALSLIAFASMGACSMADPVRDAPMAIIAAMTALWALGHIITLSTKDK
jgi:hypothetical protein